jgi:hypothetical protein
VNAIDTAKGPEVEDDNLTAKVLDVDRSGRVEPADAAVEVRGVGALRLAGWGRLRIGLLTGSLAGALPEVEDEPANEQNPDQKDRQAL